MMRENLVKDYQILIAAVEQVVTLVMPERASQIDLMVISANNLRKPVSPVIIVVLPVSMEPIRDDLLAATQTRRTLMPTPVDNVSVTTVTGMHVILYAVLDTNEALNEQLVSKNHLMSVIPARLVITFSRLKVNRHLEDQPVQIIIIEVTIYMSVFNAMNIDRLVLDQLKMIEFSVQLATTSSHH